jgi:hypothetical protein
MRLLLILAVLALGTDALRFNGAYIQAAWREASVFVGKVLDQAHGTTGDIGGNG